MICTSCGVALEAGDVFCGNCGASVPETSSPGAPPASLSARCAACGSALLPDSVFCTTCGAPVAPSHVTAATDPAKPLAAPARPRRRRRTLVWVALVLLLLGVPAAGLGYLRVTGADRAEEMLREGRYQEAIAWCDLLIRLHVTADFWTYANRARALAFLGQHEAAAREFDRLGRESPGTDAVLFGLQGWFFEQKGELDTALHYYDESLRRNPNHATRHIDRGRALALQGQFAPALEAYERALQLDPANQYALRGRQLVADRLGL